MPLDCTEAGRAEPFANATGRAMLRALPAMLLLADGALLAAWLAPLDPRGALLSLGLPPVAAVAFGWRSALSADRLAGVLGPFVLALAAGLAGLGGLADLAGAPPRADTALLGAAGSLVLLRLALCVACRRAERRHGWASERTAILGTGPACRLLCQRLRERRPRGTTLAAQFEPTAVGIDALLRLARAQPLDRVLLAMPAGTDPAHCDDVVRRLKAIDVRVERCAAELLAHGPTTDAELPTVLLAGRPIPSAGLACKAALDALLSLLLLVLIAPALLAVMVAIRLDSPGPVLFRQQREGRNGTDFEILKFRTMTWRAPDRGACIVQTSRNDGRVTRVGRVLRATSLDELPQLLNVLRGDMSLIGPRPHPQAMLTGDRFSVDIDADYPLRHRVRPGMTGWAQVNGSRGGLHSPEELCRRLRYDLHYIENWSLLLDLRIALLTPLKMIFHDGAAY